MQSPKAGNRIFQILFFLLPIVYFGLFGWRGFSDTDQGFMLGLSWRMASGWTIFQDFIYVRPPLSPWLHAQLLHLFPENFQLLGSRFLFYLFMWGSVLLGIQTIQKVFSSEKWGLSVWLLGCIGFVLSVHNFPPMAWHTVDGILLSSLGLFFLTRKPHWGWGMAGMIALLLSIGCKQSFYPMPIVGLAVLIWRHPWKSVGLSLLGVCLGLILPFFLFVWDWELFSLFRQHTEGTSSLSDLIDVGILKYLKPVMVITLPSVFGALGLKWLADRGKLPEKISQLYEKGLFGWLFWGGALAMISVASVKALVTGVNQPPQFGYPQALFGVSFFVVVMGLIRKKADYGVLLAMLALSWCSGISWGYAWPVLVFVPILAGVLDFVKEHLRFDPPKWFYPICLCFLFLLNFNLYRFPYKDQGPHTHHLGEVFPKATGIFVGEANFKKHAELKSLIHRYGDEFSVLPAMPLAHFLNGTQPPSLVDWAHNAEANWDQNSDRLLERLNNGPKIVFIEIDKLQEAENEGKYGSQLTAHVLDNWKLVESEEFFHVYER